MPGWIGKFGSGKVRVTSGSFYHRSQVESMVSCLEGRSTGLLEKKEKV